MVLAATSVGAGFAAAFSAGHWLGGIFAIAGVGLAAILTPISIAAITVGSIMMHKGKKEQLGYLLEESEHSQTYAYIAPITTEHGGGGLALSGRF